LGGREYLKLGKKHAHHADTSEREVFSLTDSKKGQQESGKPIRITHFPKMNAVEAYYFSGKKYQLGRPLQPGNRGGGYSWDEKKRRLKSHEHGRKVGCVGGCRTQAVRSKLKREGEIHPSKKKPPSLMAIPRKRGGAYSKNGIPLIKT